MIGAVVQARMSSTRLPGKVLRPLAGRTVLGLLLDRLARAKTLDLVVVATSTDPSDDPIAAFCRAEDVECHRGPLEDVAARFLEVIERYDLDATVRICADSPLLDQRLVDRAVERFADGGRDVVGNVALRGFPAGQSVEVFSAAALRRALPQMPSAYDREHVTPYLYRHPELFTSENLAAPEDWTSVRLAVDTEEDLARIAAMLARMDSPHWEYDCVRLVRLYEETE